MELEFDWKEDGDIVSEILNETWKEFGLKHGMGFRWRNDENIKLVSCELIKNDFGIKVSMSRTLPFESNYYSISKSCESRGIYRLYEMFIPKDKSLKWFFENEGLGFSSSTKKKTFWKHSVKNQIFLLEKYCSDLLETGDICGWLEKHQISDKNNQ